mmetsp:Transcript_19110/g.40208  ORF Transcript_19110/g.40208 Transcript_19110/m.40208 type:complete len:131 (-) Transcript_19110:244-636(-)
MSFSQQLNVIGERFSPHSTPLKPWSKVQIDAFTKSDPVNGKRLQALRNAGVISYAAGCFGFLAGATVFYRRNGTFNGGAVAAIIGGIPSFIVGHQIAQQATTFTHELYKFDAQDVNHTFFKWWAANGGSE